MTAAAVWLGWQIAIQPVKERAPAAVAIRVAPTSPMVLGRAAEAELAAGRNDNAAALGRNALARSPFDSRALGIVGLTEARANRLAQADDLLTLVGNWSLRHDPAHAWLVERRLRTGDYSSAFAHADTLARRREDLQPQIFRLLTVAATSDPQRALPEVADLLTATPPWRWNYLRSLDGDPASSLLAAQLGTMLESGPAPLSDIELHRLYLQLLRYQQFDAIRQLHARVDPPSPTGFITDGGFDASGAAQPFRWQVSSGVGVAAQIVAGEPGNDGAALRVESSGFRAGRAARQLLLLPPGPHRFGFRTRSEAGTTADDLSWTVTCIPDRRELFERRIAPQASWKDAFVEFTVPEGCRAQWLNLMARDGARRAPAVLWFDEVSISRPE